MVLPLAAAVILADRWKPLRLSSPAVPFVHSPFTCGQGRHPRFTTLGRGM